MFIEDMYVGMKVVPLKRTTQRGEFKSTHSMVWREVLNAGSEKPFLTVQQLNEEGPFGLPTVLCGTSSEFADWFVDTDLVEFRDSGTPDGYPK